MGNYSHTFHIYTRASDVRGQNKKDQISDKNAESQWDSQIRNKLREERQKREGNVKGSIEPFTAAECRSIFSQGE